LTVIFLKLNFFTEFERFDRHIDKLRRKESGSAIDYISICSPNYLHDSHMRFALRSNADAICEKPLVLNPWNIDGLIEIEKDTGRNIHTILQLRLHDAIVKLKHEIEKENLDEKYDVDLTYITSRGHWYLQSWKGDINKSGGIATNIGVHFFDMLHYLFGEVLENTVHYSSPTTTAGYLEYNKARVRWFLSIDSDDLPDEVRKLDQRTYRSISINNEEIEFSGGFTDLHTRSYEEILSGNGFSLEDNRITITTVADIRNQSPVGKKGNYHRFLDKKLKK